MKKKWREFSLKCSQLSRHKEYKVSEFKVTRNFITRHMCPLEQLIGARQLC